MDKTYQLILFVFICLLSFSGTLTAQETCDVSAGRLIFADSTSSFQICLNRENDEFIDFTAVDTTEGPFRYFITNSGGTILRTPEGGPPFSLSGFNPGGILIWRVAYTGRLFNDDFRDNICNIRSTDGCLNLSNPLRILRITIAECPDSMQCMVNGGMISLASEATDTTICIDDGPAPLEVVTDGRAMGDSTTFIITDSQNEILSIPDDAGPFDLTGAGEGQCLIYQLAYDASLNGLVVGNSVDDFNGCFALSNPIIVNRNTGEDCDEDPCNLPDVPMISLAGGEDSISTCVDSIAGLADFTVQVDGEIDADNFALILLNSEDLALNVALDTLGPVDFSRQGVAFDSTLTFPLEESNTELSVVLIYYEDGANPFSLLDSGCDIPCPKPIDSLSGCFTVSNAIDIQIGSCDELTCDVEAGMISLVEGGVDTTICVDSTAAPIEVVFVDTTAAAMGDSLSFVITDSVGIILSIPDGNGPFNLTPAGPGQCIIYYLAYDSTLVGLMSGSSIDDFDGCFALSNGITVTRNGEEDCEEDGIGGRDRPFDGAANQLTVFPNPVNDHLTVEYDGLRAENTVLQVLNLGGTLVEEVKLTGPDGRQALTISALPPGTYILRIANEAGISVRRIVKQ